MGLFSSWRRMLIGLLFIFFQFLDHFEGRTLMLQLHHQYLQQLQSILVAYEVLKHRLLRYIDGL